MVYHVNDNNLFKHVTKHSKIIWFLFKKGQETSSLTLKPFGDEIESVNKELSEQFPNVVFFQSFISENPKIMDTLLRMVFELHPDLVPIPPSKG